MNAAVKVRRFLVVLCLLGLTACMASKATIQARSPIEELNVSDTLALKGYDPVAYFTVAQAVPGNPQFSHVWKGATWHFHSAENRAAFQANPDKYAPQYGGYCAYAIANGNIADISPKRWAIVNNKLYLNNNVLAHTLWETDSRGHIESGDANWQITPRKPLPTAKN